MKRSYNFRALLESFSPGHHQRVFIAGLIFLILAWFVVTLKVVDSFVSPVVWFQLAMGATALLDHVRFEISSGMDLRSQEMIDQTRERLAKMGFKPEEILTNY